MFAMSHATEYEVASLRARLRWADTVSALLGKADARVEDSSTFALAPQVLAACSPALEELRDRLANRHLELSRDVLHDVIAVVRAGPNSPLFGDDADAARRAVLELLSSVSGNAASVAAELDLADDSR